jgi:glycosyltransferase involved in cell wall biosynthesis
VREGHTAGRRIVCLATQGDGHIEGERIRVLLEPLAPQEYRFRRESKLRSAAGLLRLLLRERPDLVVMEGTGTAGGVPLLLARALRGVPYVVSSGDAVGPFLGLKGPAMAFAGGIYERALCRFCAGFVGWTPYLSGRALTFGAARAMTAPGWTRAEPTDGARERVRRKLGVPDGAIVIGLAGSLHWSARRRYVYGLEIVQAAVRAGRDDVFACVVGDGDGLDRLRELAGEQLGRRVLLPGRVAPARVPDYLAAFDIGSLSQSVDRIGSFRYTTKLSEYLAVGLPVVTGQVPLSYDLDEGYMWRLEGDAPWSPVYIDALTRLLASITHEEISRRREAALAAGTALFDRGAQQRRMTAFVEDLLDARAQRG